MSHVLSMSFVVAVVGATGAVGREMLKILEQRRFPIKRLAALASARSAGKTLPFAGGAITVEELTPRSLQGVEFALFSAGASVSREMAPVAAAAGAVVIWTYNRLDPRKAQALREMFVAAEFEELAYEESSMGPEVVGVSRLAGTPKEFRKGLTMFTFVGYDNLGYTLPDYTR